MTDKITRGTHPEIFDRLDEDYWDYEELLKQERGKYDLTNCLVLVSIDEEDTVDESLWGHWGGWVCFSYEDGLVESPDEIYRMEEKEVTRVEWVYSDEILETH